MMKGTKEKKHIHFNEYRNKRQFDLKPHKFEITSAKSRVFFWKFNVYCVENKERFTGKKLCDVF